MHRKYYYIQPNRTVLLLNYNKFRVIDFSPIHNNMYSTKFTFTSAVKL